MNKLPVLQVENIINKIFEIRGSQVMIDSDLSTLYQIETKNLNKAVKRNLDRFPSRFMFQLTITEWENLRFQFGTSSLHYGGRRYLPYVFTEQGVAMLSAIIKSPIAIKISIEIIEAFVLMRKTLLISGDIYKRFEKIELKQTEADQNFEKLFKALEERSEKKSQGIFFNGQIFDSYKLISDIIKTANESIVLIDNYIDESTLVHLTKRKENVIIKIVTQKLSSLQKLDFDKFNLQYKNAILKESNIFHDRFLIIDNKEVFHLGASLKDLGKKVFAFSKINIDSIVLLSKLS
jgi:hypothetical protein